MNESLLNYGHRSDWHSRSYVETWICSFFALKFYTNFSVEVVSSIITQGYILVEACFMNLTELEAGIHYIHFTRQTLSRSLLEQFDPKLGFTLLCRASNDPM